MTVNARKVIPGEMMGFIMGAASYIGDFDLMTDDKGLLEENDLLDLRLGDIVFIRDCDCSYYKNRQQGSVTVGVVSTTNNPVVGRGVGIMPLFASSQGKIRPRLTEKANLSVIMEEAAK